MTERAHPAIRSDLARFALFALGGGLATLTHAATAYVLLGASGAFIPSYLGGFAVAFLVSFTFHYAVTFRSVGVSPVWAALRFFAVATVGCGLSLAVAAPLAAYSKPLGLLVGAALIPIVTFLGARFWAFAGHDHVPDAS